MDTEPSHTSGRSSILDPPASIFIVGAGGIGCAVGYSLLAAGIPITFVETNLDKIRWGQARGVAIDRRQPLPAEFVPFDGWMPPARATAVLCTKCYDNARVLSRLPADVTIVPIQNGFDPALDGRSQVEGIASFVSECAPDRPHARITRRGRLHFGSRVDTPLRSEEGKGRGGEGATSSSPPFPVPPSPPLPLPRSPPRLLVDALQGSDLFRTELVPNIMPFKYTKLMYNAAISPLAAAAGLDNGQLLSVARARRLFFQLLQENYSILHDAQIPLATIGPFHPDRVAGILRRPLLANVLAWAFYPTLRRTYCSMSGDLPKGQTEIEYYNRHLIDLAGERDCPLNRRVCALIKRMEAERISPALEMLDELILHPV